MMTELITRTISAVVLLGCFFWAYLHSTLLFSLLLLAALFIITVFEWSKLIDITRKFRFIVICLLYPIFPMLSLILLNRCYRSVDMLLPLYPFLISWVYDTMGYFVGKAIGYHKICPTISPGKTWEGLMGSLIGVFLANVFFLQQITIEPFYDLTKRFSTILIFSVLITLTAFAGGMMISYLKRSKGLKDTGSLLPGHGGLLDRFDSILFVGLLVWVTMLVNALLR